MWWICPHSHKSMDMRIIESIHPYSEFDPTTSISQIQDYLFTVSQVVFFSPPNSYIY
jgi:hypothetical protein